MTQSANGPSSNLPAPKPPLPNLLRDFLAIALLWALVIAFFWKIALVGRVLAGGDLFTYFYPYWAEATRAIRAGRLPLWNPYLFMGAPFLANSQAGVFYPLNWLLWLLLPAHRSVHLTVVLHLCLASLNGYLWGRGSLGLERVGAWTVGATFALGGYLGAHVEHVNQLQGLAWLPLALMLVDKTLYTPHAVGQVSIPACFPDVGKVARPEAQSPKSKTAFAGLALVVSMIFLAGHTQTVFISLLGLAAYGLGPALWNGLRRCSFDCRAGFHTCRLRKLRKRWRPLVRRAALLAVVTGLGAMLAAVQLLPTWELSRLSVRAGGLPFNERVSFSLSPLYLARALLPGFSGSVLPERIEHVAYVGIAGLALAAVGLCASVRRQPSNPSANSPIYQFANLPIYLLIVLGLFLSLGLYNPLYLLLARFVPGFAHFRVPARWLALYAVGVSALAGWGADALWRCEFEGPILREFKGRVGWRALLLFAVALVALAGWAVAGVCIVEERGVGWPTVAGWVVGIGLVLGLSRAATRAPRPAMVGLLVLLIVELFAAGLTLPYGRATAPQAFTSLRPAIAHLLAARSDPPDRFLSMSDITFDPGDLPEIQITYGPQLSSDALYDYVIAAKHKEVLSPNLPLAFGVSAVDGYDGGVLPLARYVMLQRLNLAQDEVSIDGRLRENLTAIPDGRWLGLFNVRHVITDKLHDAWLDDVFYDLQFGARLEHGESAAVAHVPRFEATALGMVSYLEGGADLPDGAPVGFVEVDLGDGQPRTFELRAGQHTAEGVYRPDAAHTQAQVGGHFWPGQPEGSDYVARLRWQEPAAPIAITVRATLPEGELVVRGVSLIDERTGGFQALVLSDRVHFRLAHSGDVKIYENLDVLPRAFLVHEGVVAAEDEAALAMMQAPAFDPAAELVLSGAEGLVLSDTMFLLETPSSQGQQSARVTHYTPERVEIEVEAERPGYLVLTDAWYPGWEAAVDGEPVVVHRADLFFRAVGVDAGPHRVVFTFRPVSVRVGAGISLAGLVGLVAVVLVALSKPRRGVIMDAGVEMSSKEGTR